MKIIGISPLDKDSTVCLIEDGVVVCALAEERLSREKMHAGFPYLAMQHMIDAYSIDIDTIDKVVYAFNDWNEESNLIAKALADHSAKEQQIGGDELFAKLKSLPKVPEKTYGIPGLAESALYMKKNPLYTLAYRLLSTVKPVAQAFAARGKKQWQEEATTAHKHWSEELQKGLEHFKLAGKLERVEHHLTHAANAYYTSGFNSALIVTLDGYGSGLGGSVSTGINGKIERLHSMPYPVSLGEFYERVTSSLGFQPGRHEGKIVGLAAYEDPNYLYDVVRSFFVVEDGSVHYRIPHNFAVSRYLASQFSKPAVAAAFQKVLEDVCSEYVAYYVQKTGLRNVVLSGGVVANVKANQRIFEVDNVDQIFVHPNMGDGGCGVGAALAVQAQNKPLPPYEINDVYWGPEYSDEAILEALAAEGLHGEFFDNVEHEIARLLADGNIVARFNGRMEYGPRSLGNRSILYHAKDPTVNLWLNQKLNRTEFMPFAPATLFEERDNCYLNMAGAEYTSSFMTITFDCTPFMIENCPAAVHIDGTARPQLVSSTSNPSFYKVLTEYHRLTGIPSVINTSFNMHEEPIVCTPFDAIRAFLLGELPVLAIGSYIVKQKSQAQ